MSEHHDKNFVEKMITSNKTPKNSGLSVDFVKTLNDFVANLLNGESIG